MSQKVITLDLTDCKYIMEFHERIKKAFDFPDFYGRIGVLFGICSEASVMPIK